jgi:anti-sigma-K factor RskA
MSEFVSDYVLGQLSGDDLQAFETALKSDPKLAQSVEHMRAHFQSLGVELASNDQGRGIIAHLRTEFWSENRLPWRTRIRIWDFALGGISAATVLWAAATFGWFSSAGSAQLEARMQSAAGTLVIALDQTTGDMRVQQMAMTPPQGHDIVLWHSLNGQAARPLMRLAPGETRRLALPEAALLSLPQGARLGFTFEKTETNLTRPSTGFEAAATLEPLK